MVIYTSHRVFGYLYYHICTTSILMCFPDSATIANANVVTDYVTLSWQLVCLLQKIFGPLIAKKLPHTDSSKDIKQ